MPSQMLPWPDQKVWPRHKAFTALILLLCASYLLGAIGFIPISVGADDVDERVAALALSGMLGFFALLSWTAYHARSIELIFFCIYSTLFVLIRPFAYFLFPENVFFPIDNISIIEVKESTISYIIYLTILIIPILLINSFRISGKQKKSIYELEILLDINLLRKIAYASFMMLCVSALFSVFVYTKPDFSHLVLDVGADRPLPLFLEIILVFVNPDEYVLIMIILFFVSIAFKKRIDPFVLAMTLLSILFYIWMMSSTGSRGSGVRVVFMVASVLVVFIVLNISEQRARLLSFMAPALAVFSLLISILLLPYANKSRDNLAFIGTQYEETQISQSEYQSYQSNLERMFHSIVFFDYVIIGFARTPDEFCVDQYLNYDYYKKNIINYVLQGQPYPDATIPTTSLYKVCHGQISLEDLERYHSELWTTPGLLRISFPENYFIAVIALGITIGIASCVFAALPIWAYLFVTPVWLSFVPSFLTYTFSIDHFAVLLIAQGARLILPACILTALILQFGRRSRENR